MSAAFASPAFAALPPNAFVFPFDDDDVAMQTPPQQYSPSVAPWAPQRSYSPLEPLIQEGDVSSIVRNLAEEMAEEVLREPIPPPAGEAPDAGWCISMTIPDLALRLDLRHPRVLLSLLRFVETYNEIAPPGEEIYVPGIPKSTREMLFNHPSFVNPPQEFLGEIWDLRALVGKYRCPCLDCEED